MATKFTPSYKVNFNRNTGDRSVTTGKNVYFIHKVQAGTARAWYCHYVTGTQSRLFPTLRDCIIDIVYGS